MAIQVAVIAGWAALVKQVLELWNKYIKKKKKNPTVPVEPAS